MRYLATVNVSFRDKNRFQEIKRVVDKHHVDFRIDAGSVIVPFEKSDSERRERLIEDLKAVGCRPVVLYEPSFTIEELDSSELLLLRVNSFCGGSFDMWTKRTGLPQESKVMDKTEMGDLDIAKTYAWNEYVASERLVGVLENHKLTGWAVERISHYKLSKQRLPELFHLTAKNELPPLDPRTDLEIDRHENLMPEDPLYATTALIERGPLMYQKKDLVRLEDFNRTIEVFLETPVAHQYFVVSQRVREAFDVNQIRGDYMFEPVLIL